MDSEVSPQFILDDLERAADGDEGALEDVIADYLLTKEQAALLAKHKLSVLKINSGKFDEKQWKAVVAPIFHDWNTKLHKKYFGYDTGDMYECFPSGSIPNPKPLGDPYER